MTENGYTRGGFGDVSWDSGPITVRHVLVYREMPMRVRVKRGRRGVKMRRAWERNCAIARWSSCTPSRGSSS
jgi:hypothetical protein